MNRNTTHATPQSVNPYDLSGSETQTVLTKQLLWERRLLDLSLRNNLLNIRITKNTLQLIPANLACLEDALAEGDEFVSSTVPPNGRIRRWSLAFILPYRNRIR